jgi:regulatory protein
LPEITGVKDRRGKSRIFVDGEFRAEIDSNVAVERGLFEGVMFPEDELEESLFAGERALAMSRALHLLGYRARSEGELRERLARYGHRESIVERVIHRLGEIGYLDDEEFARGFASQKARKYGPQRVAMELRRIGVDAETTDAAVEEAFLEHPEGAAAREAASRRYNTSDRSEAVSRRVYRFLARRGYSSDICADVARSYRESPAE